MKTALAVMVMTIACLLVLDCHAQSMGGFQSVGGDFGRDVLASLKALDSQLNATNATNTTNTTNTTSGNNSLWNWGSVPKGSMLSNGKLVTDPFNTWKSPDFANSGMTQVGVDPYKGYPIYAYEVPNTGEIRYFYVDPYTGEPFYMDGYIGYAIVAPEIAQSGSYALPPVFGYVTLHQMPSGSPNRWIPLIS